MKAAVSFSRLKPVETVLLVVSSAGAVLAQLGSFGVGADWAGPASVKLSSTKGTRKKASVFIATN